MPWILWQIRIPRNNPDNRPRGRVHTERPMKAHCFICDGRNYFDYSDALDGTGVVECCACLAPTAGAFVVCVQAGADQYERSMNPESYREAEAIAAGTARRLAWLIRAGRCRGLTAAGPVSVVIHFVTSRFWEHRTEVRRWPVAGHAAPAVTSAVA